MEVNSFDFGAELADEIDHIKLWPTSGEMTALIDGDLLPYIIGYSIDDSMWLRAQYRVESGQVDTVAETIEFEQVKQKLCMTMNRWITGAQCDSAVIYMTDSAKNFRLDIAIQRPYKGTRKAEKPPFFYESRQFMIEHLGAILSDGEEADDLITIHMWSEINRLKEAGVSPGSNAHKEMSTLVCCSKDKDLAITAGWHYNIRDDKIDWTDQLGELLPEWGVTPKGTPTIKKLRGTGIKFFYSQLLQGDTVDNYTGIPRMKLKDILDLLDPCKNEEQLYMATLSAYKKKYTSVGSFIENFRGGGRLMLAHEIMHEQARLAWMQTYKGEVWRSHKVPLLLGSDESLWK